MEDFFNQKNIMLYSNTSHTSRRYVGQTRIQLVSLAVMRNIQMSHITTKGVPYVRQYTKQGIFCFVYRLTGLQSTYHCE